MNSHLEALSSDLALDQAGELLAKAVVTDRTTVFVCDCNSDRLDGSVKPQDHVPHKAPYDLIVGAGGFTDQWLEWAPAEQGWTSGLSELVNDTTAGDFDHRIDMVFGRTAGGDGLQVDRGQVTGDELGDQDPATGLWPSDHAGVVLRLCGPLNRPRPPSRPWPPSLSRTAHGLYGIAARARMAIELRHSDLRRSASDFFQCERGLLPERGSGQGESLGSHPAAAAPRRPQLSARCRSVRTGRVGSRVEVWGELATPVPPAMRLQEVTE